MQIRANTANEIRPDVAVRAALSPHDAMSARVAMQTQGGAPDVSSVAAIFTISKLGWLHQFFSAAVRPGGIVGMGIEPGCQLTYVSGAR